MIYRRPILPRLSVAQLLAAKKARPIQSLDELTAKTFDSDQELEAFLAHVRVSRNAGLSGRQSARTSAPRAVQDG